jgi:hypothetical protein
MIVPPVTLTVVSCGAAPAVEAPAVEAPAVEAQAVEATTVEPRREAARKAVAPVCMRVMGIRLSVNMLLWFGRARCQREFIGPATG